MKTKNEKAISTLIAVTIAFSILVAFSATASATTIYVPEGGNQTIQQAVDNATGGDIIIVRDGTYNENVNVYVASLTIRSENGSANCVVNASDPNDAVFRVNETPNYVNISGFTVTGGSRGILLHWVDHCNISNNIVSGNGWGIGLYGRIGVPNYADYNTVKDNIISNNTEGIWMYKARYSTIINNTILNNTNRGIHMDTYSNSNTIKDNDVQGNNRGIEVAGPTAYPCSDNVVNCNNIVGNSAYGVWNHPDNLELNATQNWWGDTSGPSGVGPGTGDAVSANVDFDPWSFTPDPCEAKTIGFWKNHEDSVNAVLDDYGPIYLGNDSTVYYYEVNDSDNATAVFNNATNKNALNMLAAQLLAAELNVLHLEHLNIAYCDCIDDVIDDADEFLSEKRYTGPGGTAKVTGKDKQPANLIKNDLDDFNQGLCPCTLPTP